MGGRAPRVQKVRAEADQKARRGKVVGGDRRPVEADAAGLSERLVAERLVGEQPLGTQRGQPMRGQVVQAVGQPAGEERESVRRPVLPDLSHPFGKQCLGLAPRQRREPAGRRAPHRAAEPVGIVQPLQRGVAARTQAAPVRRMGRVALDLDGAPFTRADQHSATGRAFLAHGGVIGRHPGRNLLRLDHVRNQGLDRLGRAADDRRRGSRTQQLEEIASVESAVWARHRLRFALSCHCEGAAFMPRLCPDPWAILYAVHPAGPPPTSPAEPLRITQRSGRESSPR